MCDQIVEIFEIGPSEYFLVSLSLSLSLSLIEAEENR